MRFNRVNLLLGNSVSLTTYLILLYLTMLYLVQNLIKNMDL